MANQLTKFVLIFFLATNVFAGGDDRDDVLVESLDAVSNSTCTDAEGTAPCAEKVASLDEEALTMALAAQEQAAEQAILDEIAAFEAELAAQQLADNLAAFQAKIDAERALSAKNLASFQAKQAAEKEIAEFEAALAAEQALAQELADFEAELAASLELDKQHAAEQVVLDEIAAFEAALAAEEALAQELTDFEAELAASLELDKQQVAALAAKLAAELAAFEAYHSCKATLNLSDANIAKFKAGIAAGNLYNIGPQVSNGTSFTPRRWDTFFSCQEPDDS